MARTQFTFTFTNAQPGADVHFSAPVYPDASTPTPDGPTLVLSSANAVSVWADAGFLVAVSVDGNGNEISATATAGSPTVSTDSGTAGTSPFGSGGSVPYGHSASFINNTPSSLASVPANGGFVDVASADYDSEQTALSPSEGNGLPEMATDGSFTFPNGALVEYDIAVGATFGSPPSVDVGGPVYISYGGQANTLLPVTNQSPAADGTATDFAAEIAAIVIVPPGGSFGPVRISNNAVGSMTVTMVSLTLVRVA